MTKEGAKSVRRANRRGFNQFNLMVAGHCNSGKTSFIKTVYHTTDIKKLHFPEGHDETTSKENIFPSDDITTPTPINAKLEFVSEASIERLLLRLTDTPGIPIPVDLHKRKDEDFSQIAHKWIKLISAYIESQYEATLLEESKVKRNPKSPDYQIHACLYFIDPWVVIANDGLTSIDRIVLEKLSDILNVIPCLGKSDLLSSKQLKKIKKMVMDDITKSGIPIQTFEDPEDDEDGQSAYDDDSDYDDDGASYDRDVYIKSLPFALISGEELDEDELENVQLGDENILNWTLCRKYPWGTANVENPEHGDFVKLKDMLFGIYLQDFKDITREVFYEKWRTKKLLEVRQSIAVQQQTAPGKNGTRMSSVLAT